MTQQRPACRALCYLKYLKHTLIEKHIVDSQQAKNHRLPYIYEAP